MRAGREGLQTLRARTFGGGIRWRHGGELVRGVVVGLAKCLGVSWVRHFGRCRWPALSWNGASGEKLSPVPVGGSGEGALARQSGVTYSPAGRGEKFCV